MGEEGIGAERGRWGTWEELLLGGAVLRHGTGDWTIVASELQTRTLCPYSFTPQVCKAKYEDLQKRFSGCKACFEELRNKRVADLRQALALSEESIGSLESKLEILKAKKQDYGHINDEFSQMELSIPLENLEGFETSSKETSKDGLSASSYTLERKTSWSSECQIPAIFSFAETNNEHDASHSPQQGKTSIIEKLVDSMCVRQGQIIKKKRGKRKRKDCNRDVKEVSVGESSFWDSADDVIAFRSKENTTSDCGEVSRSFGPNDQNRGSTNDLIDDLLRHFNSILELKSASTFHHRLDSQKRGRYKKMIKKHMDFGTLRSRIISGSIISVKELFHDMLLLANNALVFYSKNTREFKSALLLREFTTTRLKQYLKDSCSKIPAPTLRLSLTILDHPIKPQGGRVYVLPSNIPLSAKAGNAENTANTSLGGRKPNNNIDSSPSVESLVVKKKGFGHNQLSISPIKGRKRGRTR